jgi:hypothetical protein
MRKLIRKLRRMGFKVRNGGWPATRACEARWDFCCRRGALFSMTEEGVEAVHHVLTTEHHVCPEHVAIEAELVMERVFEV